VCFNLKKFYTAVVALVLTAALSIPAFAAVPDNSTAPPAASGQQITLTDAQKAELKSLYNQKFEIQKKIIQKYVDFGVITKEMADKRLKRMDEMKKKIEESGFIPRHGKGFGEQKKD
jgi:ABC-type transporter MlaC component